MGIPNGETRAQVKRVGQRGAGRAGRVTLLAV